TVLVVDDSEVNLNFMRTLLEPFGYRVLTATRPNEALTIARARKPDLIISDVHLAHYSGYDLPKLLRSDPRLASVPCILISSTDGSEALSNISHLNPDLVIGDILMPTMDGYEFVHRLRQSPALAHMRVIFYSATYHHSEAAALARSCGALRVIAKPADPQELN